MRPSLTRRLLALHVTTILAVVGIAGLLVWVMMSRALRAGLDEALRTEALALAGRLEAEHGALEFEWRPADQTHHPQQPDAVVYIADQRGTVVFSSLESAGTAGLAERMSAATARQSPLWFALPATGGGPALRAVALHVTVHAEDEWALWGRATEPVGAWIVVARSPAAIDRTLAQLGSVLLVAVGGSALAALLGGFVAARRGTQPVRALAACVGRVDPAAPQLDLDGGEVPVELEPIVDTTQRLLHRVRAELSRQRQLTADVAHDLRTPVAAVRTLLDVCVQRRRAAPEYELAIDKARAALRQLSQLLDDTLALSRLDAGADQPALAPVLLEEALGAAVATVQPLAAARGVTIETAASPAAQLRTDRSKLAKILLNLLTNAVEHSSPGQVVRVAARIDAQGLQVAVADRGPGVPAEIRGRIFDRFVRGDAARGGADGHHGLGLPIAAGLARVLGGRVALDESYEPGSCFVVHLPLG